MTIVVGVDGSAVSIEALKWAIDEAARRGTQVDAVNAWHSDPTTTGLSKADIIQLRPRSEVEEEQRQLLGQAIEEAVGATKKVEIRQVLLDGQPGAALIHAAQAADLLVVGSHGAGRLAEVLLGSVSAYCVHHASCPVVVVPEQHPERAKAPHTAAAPVTMGPLY